LYLNENPDLSGESSRIEKSYSEVSTSHAVLPPHAASRVALANAHARVASRPGEHSACARCDSIAHESLYAEPLNCGARSDTSGSGADGKIACTGVEKGSKYEYAGATYGE
jgi:hypothetical protein